VKSKTYFVYIVTNTYNTVFYTGVTNNLSRRIYEHKNKMIEGFTKKYNVWKLVYYEQSENIATAIEQEKQLKNWRRQWKIELIKKTNPNFEDLYEVLF